jgi:hypothetical protein
MISFLKNNNNMRVVFWKNKMMRADRKENTFHIISNKDPVAPHIVVYIESPK